MVLNSYNFKYQVINMNLVYLPLRSIVRVHQLAAIFMSPGIEPGNLIRSTLIKSLPGAFFEKKISNKVTGVT